MQTILLLIQLLISPFYTLRIIKIQENGIFRKGHDCNLFHNFIFCCGTVFAINYSFACVLYSEILFAIYSVYIYSIKPIIVINARHIFLSTCQTYTCVQKSNKFIEILSQCKLLSWSFMFIFQCSFRPVFKAIKTILP